MKFILSFLVVALAAQALCQSGLTADEQQKVARLQKVFRQCRANAASLTVIQKNQCASTQAELKQIQNEVAIRSGAGPSASDDAVIDKELNVRLDPNLTLLKVTGPILDNFLKSEVAVGELVNCFESARKCRHRAGTSLVNDVLKLSRGLRCTDCSPEEQKKLRAVVTKAINGLQSNHPKAWKRLLPHIGFLL